MKLHPMLISLLFTSLTLSATVHATSFIIEHGDTETTQQTLNDNETGVIETDGTLATGADAAVNAPGADVNITNSGSISTTGSSAYGIRSYGTNANITNNGSISTAGYGAYGIRSDADNASVSNSGSISTTGSSAYGIRSDADNASITNSGSISTAGGGAYGIRSDADNASITNSGSIITTGSSAYGIRSDAYNASITNSGSISTAGNGAYGIRSDADNASITNSGSIIISGDGAYGIRSGSDNTSITNSGSITATGTGVYAIQGDSGTNQKVNTLPGSRILGAIDLGGNGDADVANIYGSFGSAVLTFANTETINVYIDNAVLVGNSTVVVVDPTGESITANTLNALTSGAHQVISQRMQHRPTDTRTQSTDLDLAFQEQGSEVWGQWFGYNSKRGVEGSVQAYNYDYKGYVVGYEHKFARVRVGLLAGVTNSDTNSNTHDRETESVFLGAYGYLNLGKANLTASLLLGRENHDNRRWVLDNLNGIETSHSSTDSYFISPSLTLSSAFRVRPDIELRPSATLTYSAGRYDGYEESGTTHANFNVDSRNVEALSTRLHLEGAKQINGGEINLRAGVQTRHTDADDVKVSLAGSNFQFHSASDNNVSGEFIGLGANLRLNNNLELVADLESGQMSGAEDYLSGQLTLQYRF